MIRPVDFCSFIPRLQPSVFNEGAASTASKVVACVAAALASLASIYFFPGEGALMLSAGTIALLSWFCCTSDAEEGAQPQRWYQPVVNAFRVFIPERAVPVVQPGPRVPVGGILHPHVQPAVVVQNHPVGHQEGPRVPVGHGHRFPAAPVVAPQPAVRPAPAIHVALAEAPPHPQGGPAPHHVPVGHGHRLPAAPIFVQQPQPPALPAAAHPAVRLGPAGAPPHPQGGPAPHRVPVGHGNRP